jgi:signal peptide peptidase SppA
MLANTNKIYKYITVFTSLVTIHHFCKTFLSNKKSECKRFSLYDYKDISNNIYENKSKSLSSIVKNKKKIYLVFDFDTMNKRNKIANILNFTNKLENEFEALEAFVSYVIANYTFDETTILLRISSPGGSSYKYERMYTTLLRLKTHKFATIAFVDDYCASGGYMLACACDIIICSETGKVGSVGVFIEHINYKELLDKVGITEKIIKTSENKGFSNFNGCDDVEKQYEIADKKIKYTLDMFKSIVTNSRKNIDIDTILEAKIFYGKDALSNGLIDVIGNLDDYLLNLSKDSNNIIFYVVNFKTEEKTNLFSTIVKSIIELTEPIITQMNLGIQNKLHIL